MRKVSPAVANFAQTKVGDMVSLGFEDRLTFVLSGPNTKTPGDRDSSVTVAAGTGTSVAGASAGQAVANWWVTAVNPAANTISLVNPAGGEIRTYNVSTPEGRAQLPRVKPGDSLTAINSQRGGHRDHAEVGHAKVSSIKACRCACPKAAPDFPATARAATTACRDT